MGKAVSIECLVEQTLVKDESGKKVKVKRGDVFKTDSVTAEVYLTAYKRLFRLVSEDAVSGNPQRELELENKIQELEETIVEKDKEIEGYKERERTLQLEALREKHIGKELKDIPYNDLIKIAKLKGVTFTKNPKAEELVQMIINADAKKEWTPDDETQAQDGVQAE